MLNLFSVPQTSTFGQLLRLPAKHITFNPVGHVSERAAGCQHRACLPSWISRAELSVYTHHQLLRDTDMMSMAHSLEVREPLLDHRLVEAALPLQALLRPDRHIPKALLIDALGSRLPSLIRKPRPKRGFVLPFDVWMRSTLRPQIEDRLLHLETSAGGLVSADAVRTCWNSYLDGRTHWPRPWALTALSGCLAS